MFGCIIAKYIEILREVNANLFLSGESRGRKKPMAEERGLGTLRDALSSEKVEKLQRIADGEIIALKDLLAQETSLKEKSATEVAEKKAAFQKAFDAYEHLVGEIRQIRETYKEVLDKPESQTQGKIRQQIQLRINKIEALADREPGVRQKWDVNELFEETREGQTFGDLRRAVDRAVELKYLKEVTESDIDDNKKWMIIYLGRNPRLRKAYFPVNYSDNSTARGIHSELRKLVGRAVKAAKTEEAKIKETASVREPKNITLKAILAPKGLTGKVGVAVRAFQFRNNHSGREGYYSGAIIVEAKGGARSRKISVTEVVGPLSRVVYPTKDGFTSLSEAPPQIQRLIRHVSTVTATTTVKKDD